MKIFKKLAEKKALKAEERRKKEEKADCLKYLEQYVSHASESMYKVDTYEKTTEENGDEIEKFHTKQGPLIKKTTGPWDDRCTIYEGYLQHPVDGEVGYFRIEHKHFHVGAIHDEPNFSYDKHSYDGFCLNSNGNVTKFSTEAETSQHSGKWGEVCELIDQKIKEAKEKDNSESEME